MAHEAAVVHEAVRNLTDGVQAFDGRFALVDDAAVGIGFHAAHGRHVGGNVAD